MKTVEERFLKYVTYDTQSEEGTNCFPSTDKQKKFAEFLVKELKELEMDEIIYDKKYGYVYAKLYAQEKQKEKTLGFIAHMDTSPEVCGKNVKPQLVKNYTGKEIMLNDKYTLSPKEFPELKNYIGKDLITTDGNTLLGADDKAGVAEIMTMLAFLQEHKEIKHRTIAIAFTPDEEIGGGMDHFDLKKFGAEYAYTVDGGALGEVEYENFNAAEAIIDIKGRSVHPGNAKRKMKNATLMAIEFETKLPKLQKPVYTEGYEGFFHLTSIKGNVEKATLHYIIRDHDFTKFEEKKKTIIDLCRKLNKKYGEGAFLFSCKDQYYNMKEKIEPYIFLIDNAIKGMKELGIEPKVTPIRGGTDGSRLSFMGIPCPNLCTGGENYHGRFEYCCIQSMEKIVQLLLKLVS